MIHVKFWPSPQAVGLAPNQSWPVVWPCDQVPGVGEAVAFGDRRWVVDVVLWSSSGGQQFADLRVSLLVAPDFVDPWSAVA